MSGWRARSNPPRGMEVPGSGLEPTQIHLHAARERRAAVACKKRVPEGELAARTRSVGSECLRKN